MHWKSFATLLCSARSQRHLTCPVSRLTVQCIPSFLGSKSRHYDLLIDQEVNVSSLGQEASFLGSKPAADRYWMLSLFRA